MPAQLETTVDDLPVGVESRGDKSYGRATFLLATGSSRVRSVVAAITGDLAGADRVRLALPTDGGCQRTCPATRPAAAAAAASIPSPRNLHVLSERPERR